MEFGITFAGSPLNLSFAFGAFGMRFIWFYPGVLPAFLRAEAPAIKPQKILMTTFIKRHPTMLTIAFCALIFHWLLSLRGGQATPP